MSKFRVVQPCVYALGGAAVHHREPGALVDLPPAVAAELGDAVERIAAPRRPRKMVSEPSGDCSLGNDGE